TTGWQISLHNSVAGGTVMILALALGPWLLLTTLGAAAIGWSRMVLNAHTFAQILAGTALGCLATLVFGLLH
ncbi:MAG: phosphatase PAP2 family protein, partial [Streptomyces sp.]|nr:phosphatase PAP2 family protein [Streptomyces sp.]